MLGKLLKYDFKWINKVMYVYYVILFILSIAVKVVESMEKNLLIVIIDKIVSAMFIGCIISIIITCIMRGWSRFISNVYKDESYLTHTLPVTKKQIFNSKILASTLSLILSVLVILACLAIVFVNKDTIYSIKVMFQSLVDAYGTALSICFILGIVLLIFLEIFYFMMSGIFGIVCGHSSNNHKTIKSIIIGIASYGVLTVILFLVLLFMSKTVDLEIISNGFPAIDTIRTMGLTAIIIYLVYDLAYYFIAKAILNKGVNVE